MKDTMNSRDIAKFHKLLLKDVSNDDISKFLQVSVETLKRFTPEKIKASNDERKKSENYESKQLKKKQNSALDLTKNQAE